jgi:hypothetical protein
VWYRFVTTFFILILIATGVYAGYSYRDSQQVEAQISAPELRIIEVPVETIEYVKVPVEVTREVVKEVYKPLSDFGSLKELEIFLANDKTDEKIVITLDDSGNTPLAGQCEDWAFTLIKSAERSGKRLHLAIIENEYSCHAVCLAVIGNDLYYIEPSDDVVWKSKYVLDPK